MGLETGKNQFTPENSNKSSLMDVVHAFCKSHTAKIVVLISLGCVGLEVYTSTRDRHAVATLELDKERLRAIIEKEFDAVLRSTFPTEEFPEVHTPEFRRFVVHVVFVDRLDEYRQIEGASPLHTMHMYQHSLELLSDPKGTCEKLQAYWNQQETMQGEITHQVSCRIEEGNDRVRNQESLELPEYTRRPH